MNIVITGSIAYDYLMTFPGRFQEHILPNQLANLSVSFLVDSMVRQRGGVAPNIAYTLALLGERPRVMATVGQDFDDYRAWLETHGVDTSAILTIADDFTASFFVSTDRDNNQFAMFYTGAMAHAHTRVWRLSTWPSSRPTIRERWYNTPPNVKNSRSPICTTPASKSSGSPVMNCAPESKAPGW